MTTPHRSIPAARALITANLNLDDTVTQTLAGHEFARLGEVPHDELREIAAQSACIAAFALRALAMLFDEAELAADPEHDWTDTAARLLDDPKIIRYAEFGPG
jgi:hypothetical protein